MAEHQHGEMDISDQESMFAGFVRFVAWTIGIILIAVILLAMINA
ncbi:MAG: aa3-type cytochrome c oxidase subunit IV [Rhodobacter sp.]|nr:aa3-type cytochrome c oxidase subunit IV [Rhodobacter sp.]MCY4168408.1 aa3-type cytochrome c oxidase subunit IV [Rhodobacter sp.]MCY4241119.1 aa3-type cytochrome c oxidase subunit IV [Rhodobacter sp.]